MTVLDEVAAERRRQMETEGRTPEHDDRHRYAELARAAAVYAAGGGLFKISNLQVPLQVWPYNWDYEPEDTRRDLIKSAALIVAEVERIDRAAARKTGEYCGGGIRQTTEARGEGAFC